jgi:thiaminase
MSDQNIEPDQDQALWDEVLQEREGDGEPGGMPESFDDDASTSLTEAPAETDWKAEAERLRSHSGRVSALSKQNAELKALVEQAGSGNAEQPTQRETSQALKDPAKWAEYEESWPDEAEAIREYMAQERQQIRQEILNEVSPYLNYIQQTSQQSSQAAFESAVGDEDHQDWKEVWQSTDFGEWFHAQPEAVKSMHQSSNPKDIHWLLDTYKQSHGVNTGKANALQQQRQQRLQRSESVNGARIPKAGTAPQDDDALWEWTAKQREAKKQRMAG